MTGNPWYRLDIFRAALRLVSLLPRDIAQEVAGAIGRAGYDFGRTGRAAARENLARITGLRDLMLEEMCRENFDRFLRMLSDYFYCSLAQPEEHPRPGPGVARIRAHHRRPPPRQGRHPHHRPPRQLGTRRHPPRPRRRPPHGRHPPGARHRPHPMARGLPPAPRHQDHLRRRLRPLLLCRHRLRPPAQ